MQRHSVLIALAMASCAPFLGCSTPEVKPPVLASEIGQPTSVRPSASPGAQAPKADVASPTSGSINISDDILKACGDVPTARFAFDSSALAGDAERGLSALARCFTTGPLAGRTMRLVGHADPRGEEEYNLGLGQKRAGSVGAFIINHGVSATHLESSSRGALEATGTDEDGWARDRRVDISLAP